MTAEADSVYLTSSLPVLASTSRKGIEWHSRAVQIILMVLFLRIIVPTCYQYLAGEAVVSISVDLPRIIPDLYVCPAEIPDSVFAAAGYTIDDAEFIRSRLPYGPKPIFNVSTNMNRNLTSSSAGLPKVSMQSALRSLARAHLSQLPLKQYDAEYEFGRFEINTVLTAFSYCFVSEFKWNDTNDRFEDILKQLAMTINVQNIPVENRNWLGSGMSVWQGGLHLEAASFDAAPPTDNLLFPSRLFFSSGLIWVRMVYERFIKLQRETYRKSGESESAEAQCYTSCLTKTGNRCGCKMYDPYAEQNIDDLCSGEQLTFCMQTLQNAIDCQPRCKTDVGEHKVSTTISKDVFSGISPLTASWRFANQGSSTVRVEEPSITFSSLVGHVGGNMGPIFGLCCIDIIKAVFSIASRCTTKCAWTRNLGLLKSGFWIIIAVPFCLLMYDTWINYERKTTSSIVQITQDRQPFKIGLVNDWLDTKKLASIGKELQKIDPEFKTSDLASQSHILSSMLDGEALITKPTLCQYLVSMTATEAWPANATNPSVQARVSWFQSVLSKLPVVKANGIASFVIDLAYENASVVRAVKNSNGLNISFSVEKHLLNGKVVYEVEWHDSGETMFESGENEIELNVMPHNLDAEMCSVDSAAWKLLVYRDREEIVSQIPVTFVMARKMSNHKIELKGKTISLKTRKKAPCKSRREHSGRCSFSCIQTQIRCQSCISLEEYFENPPFVSNVSRVCSNYDTQYSRCPSKTLSGAKLDSIEMECAKNCGKPCDRVSFTASLTSSPKSTSTNNLFNLFSNSATEDTIKILYKTFSEEVSIEEFYLYDLPSLICIAGGTIGMLIGASFVQIIGWKIDVWKKLLKIVRRSKIK